MHFKVINIKNKEFDLNFKLLEKKFKFNWDENIDCSFV